MNRFESRITFGLAALLCSLQLAAQGFPVKPVRMVIPFPPGGSSDAVGRIMGERLGEEWKQPVVVENRPGAGTTIASAFVAGSAPDGYTLYLQGVSTHASAAGLYKNLSFDPGKAFTPVANVSMSPFILVVNPIVKANTAKELLQLAQAKPEALSYASSGSGGSPHLFVEILANANGIKFLHVPYKGFGPAIVALIAGEVNFAVADVAIMPQVRAGKVRALAVSTPKQSVLVPGVPTMAESGVPNMVMPSYIAVLGPAGMPRDITASINAQINRVLGNDDVKKKLLAQGFEPAGGTPEELGSLLNAETQRLTQIIQRTGIKLD
ncbi:MAG: Bug family tripartite tricarboxylate transporter substrate binding protein [Burkholderiales bacterium]